MRGVGIRVLKINYTLARVLHPNWRARSDKHAPSNMRAHGGYAIESDRAQNLASRASRRAGEQRGERRAATAARMPRERTSGSQR